MWSPFLHAVLITIIIKEAGGALSTATASSSTSCSVVGGDDSGNGLALSCITDAGTRNVPFSDLARAVSRLTVFNAVVSDNVNVDAVNVESLTYTGNLAEIPDDSFAVFKSLRKLTIDFSQASVASDVSPAVPSLVVLRPGAFKGLESTLRGLDLVGLNLANAGGFPVAIRRLSVLESLKFEDCPLRGELKRQDLQLLKNLRSLEIDNSPELSIADDAFSNHTDTLEKLVLNRVRLKSIPKSVSSLKLLQHFQAKSTGLTALPAVFQNSGSTLKELHLPDNAITNINATAFKALSALSVLILSQNQLSGLPSGLFDDLVSLETLDLNSNRLTTASIQKAFATLKTLKQLLLGYNQLDSITPDTLAGLENSVTVLYFSGNKIKTVKGTSKLTRSPQFILASNGIEALTPDNFEAGSTFSELILDTNPITSIQRGTFNGIAVRSLFAIDDTALTEFDLSSLSGMKGLQNLTISNNANLRSLKVSSESAVPSALEYIILDRNRRLVLTDSDGKLGSYLRKSGVRVIFDKVYCHCQLGWLREDKWPKAVGDRKMAVPLVAAGENGDVSPTRCCNLGDTSVETFLSNQLFTKQCTGDKATAPLTDNDSC